MRRTVGAFHRVLGGNLAGLFLHGSLATGDFAPRRSDLDLLALVRRPLSSRTRRTMIEAMLAVSGRPFPIEMSIVARRDLDPWRHPAPFQLHWSEDWRDHFRRQLADGSWRRWHRDRPRDGDLAAHLAMARARGIALVGPRPAAALPFIPARDLQDSLLSDGRWASRLLAKEPGMHRYAVSNACRRLALARHGFLLSKSEGLAWAGRELDSRWRPVLAATGQAAPHQRTRAFLAMLGRLERAALRSRAGRP